MKIMDQIQSRSFKMDKFKDNQRVHIIAGDLAGQYGTIWRIRHCDNGAWVEMDESLPESLRRFPEGDSRCNHIVLYPWLCEECN